MGTNGCLRHEAIYHLPSTIKLPWCLCFGKLTSGSHAPFTCDSPLSHMQLGPSRCCILRASYPVSSRLVSSLHSRSILTVRYRCRMG